MREEADASWEAMDFEEMANHLLESGAHVSPAEIHGCLSGLLSAGADAQPELGLDRLSQAIELNPHGELAELVMRLYGTTAAALLDEEYGFEPLLPVTDVDIDLRTAALANWCRGFLAGFAQMGTEPGNTERSWSTDAREILEDIAAMAQATVGEEESEEESEESYQEIVEYLRFAVLNLFTEQHALSEGAAGQPGPQDVLH